MRGLISWLAWSRYVRYCDKQTLNSQQTQYIPNILINNNNLINIDEDSDEDTDKSSSELEQLEQNLIYESVVTYVDGFVYMCMYHHQSYRLITYHNTSIALVVILNID